MVLVDTINLSWKSLKRSKQITTEHNFFYKVFIQLHVSALRSHHQADF